MNAVRGNARPLGAVQNAWQKRWQFLIAFLVIFFLSLSMLLWFDIVPDGPMSATATSSPLVENVLSPNAADAFATGEEPIKIEIPEINVSATIANPDTTNLDDLDSYLLHGAVRYPTSAELGVDGNVVLFGHSSYLPIVNNLAYKTFDGIQNLKVGDQITVYSSDRAYIYSVETVNKESATSDYAIPLTVSGRELTLSTCDSFTTKTDRFVVTATFVGSHPLGT